MGKKKSKVSKSKQAKAASKQAHKRNIPSSLGGVSMSKGLSSKFQQQQQQMGNNNKKSVLVLESKSKSMAEVSASSSAAAATFSNKFNKPRAKKVFLSSSPPPITGFGAQKNDNMSTTIIKNQQYDEQAEFTRQMASLHERQAASRNAASKQPKKKSTLLQAGGAVSTLVQSFQPASFTLEKTTTDLLHEAVGQMESMEGVGLSSLPTPVRNNQSWATISLKPVPNTSSNPFAALEEDDEDSDNEYNVSNNNNNNNTNNTFFQMAPASFTLLPRTTPTPATTPLRESQFSPPNGHDDGDGDIDPDL